MHYILLIEDEEAVLQVLQQGLRNLGHRVEGASDGQEGLRLFDRGDFDLVITDVVMPDIDGHKVARHIRNSSRPHTPIIAISGTPWSLNGDDFDCVVAKPFSLKSLEQAVEDVMSHILTFSIESYGGGVVA